METQMILTMQILESDSQIRQIILDSIKDHVEKALSLSIGSISSEIKSIID